MRDTHAPRRLTTRLAGIAFTAFALAAPTAARAQDDLAPDLQCLRYIQAQERAQTIPAGLLTAISLVEAGRPNASGQRVAWPWTLNVNGKGMFYETKEEAVKAARQFMDEGQRSIDVGCLQINLRYHPNAFKNLDDAFDPATNVAYGASFLKSLHELQGSWPNAVERFHSSDDGRRAEYREKVLAAWNDDARALITDTVMSENTDTPYHHALRDFAEGHFAQALSKYQAIVDEAPKDRLGLLGLAMTYERLGRIAEAHQSYARYLAVEPGADRVAAHVVQMILKQPPADARRLLENYAKAGVARADFMSALAEVLTREGDATDALSYAKAAAEREPTVAMYQLNAGILADRLNQKAQALDYYTQFLDLYERNPVILDASVESVRDRAKHLSSAL
jgi:tetratricopeptide (TPR) repeat protein